MLLARRGYGMVVDEVQIKDKGLARLDVEIKFDMPAPLSLAPSRISKIDLGGLGARAMRAKISEIRSPAGCQLDGVQPGRDQVALGCWTSACQARPIKWIWPDSQAETHWALVTFSSSIHILRHRTCKSTRKSTCRMLGCPRQSPSSLGRVAPAAACQPIHPSLSLPDELALRAQSRCW